MYLIREVFFCKPGKVRPLVQMFQAMNTISKRAGMPNMKLMTDMSAERYWTLVAEMEVESLQAFETMMSAPMGSAADQKELETVSAGYHDLVDGGRREIYKIEG